MEPLSLNDTQKLHQGIQKVHTLRNLDTFGVDAFSILDQLVPSNIPVFYSIRFRTRQTSPTHLPDFPGLTPAMERVVLQHFDEHPLLHHMPQTLLAKDAKSASYFFSTGVHCR